jgi:hypothetical protein
MRNIIICDIDGTVADLTHRLHLVKNGNHDWDTFHASVDKDSPREDIIALVGRLMFSPGHPYSVYFVSGRSESSREATRQWLLDNGLHGYTNLYMRPAGDTRDDRIIKKEILDMHFKKEEILLIIDDRPKVIEMWKREGLNVLDVGPGPDNPF